MHDVEVCFCQQYAPSPFLIHFLRTTYSTVQHCGTVQVYLETVFGDTVTETSTGTLFFPSETFLVTNVSVDHFYSFFFVETKALHSTVIW